MAGGVIRSGAGEFARSPIDDVVQHLEGLVFEQSEPGDPLPSEGDLAVSLGVSRLTVREGMRSMAARGLIVVSKGRRPVVAIPNGRSVGDYFRSAIRRDPRALLDLLDVRQALEVHNAALAADRAPAAVRSAMQTAIDDMAGAVDDEGRFNEADVRFHELLAVATGNQMLSTLIVELGECLRTSREQSMVGHARRGEGLHPVLEQHQEILDRVLEHDGAEAASAMRRHLAATQRDLLAAMGASR